VADPGGQIRPWPPAKLSMEFGPLGGRKRNDSTVNLSKSKDFGPPAIDAGYGFGSPTEKYHIKTLKRSITEKVMRNFGR